MYEMLNQWTDINDFLIQKMQSGDFFLNIALMLSMNFVEKMSMQESVRILPVSYGSVTT
jgi:hypothetical protein